MSNYQFAVRIATVLRTVKVTNDWKLALKIGGMTMIDANEWCTKYYGAGAFILYRRLHRGRRIENLSVGIPLHAQGFKQDAEFKAWAKVIAAQHRRPADDLQHWIYHTTNGKYICFISGRWSKVELIPFDGDIDGLTSVGVCTNTPCWVYAELKRIWNYNIDDVINNAFKDIK